MKKKFLIFLCVLGLTLLTGASAFATSIAIASLDNSVIRFNPLDPGKGETGSFSFLVKAGGGNEFKVTTGSAINLEGNITGTFNVGAITSTTLPPIPPGITYETAPVSNSGTLTILDPGHTFTATVDWLTIYTIGATGGLNSVATANITGINYTGTNTDLANSRDEFNQNAVVTFQFAGATSLTTLLETSITKTDSQSWSGSLSSVPIPLPPSALLLGTGLLGLVGWGWRRRRS